MRRNWIRDRKIEDVALGRRTFLRHTVLGLGALMAPAPLGCSSSETAPNNPGADGGAGGSGPGKPASNFANIGELGPADANGIRVAEGFTSRILARYNERPVDSSDYLWHGAPDGGAVFPTADEGWIYVSNSESVPGGVGALKFAPDGTVVDAYRILEGSIINCAGGPTPWATWLSCEEVDKGRVFECDPTGAGPGIDRPTLGRFKHEAAAVDPVNNHVYLSEDEGDGRFYRYVPDGLTPEGFADLTKGRLEVAQVAADGAVTWLAVPDPLAATTATRLQVAESTVFRGGEGLFYHEGVIYLSTKGDNKIWAYDVAAKTIRTIYDVATAADPILRGVDNITVSCCGDVLVAEDGGDMQIVAILPDGSVKPIIQIEGQDNSEITGPALSPKGDRLYFSSERAFTTGLIDGGATYEVSGPFVVT
jgi:hypothetical protein